MKLTNKTVIILILLSAIILRFINYFEIPFTHDEFSALFRLNFASFSELIEKGVKIDGHPAGIQVFLYYWTKLFGFQEWIVKLPFTIFGVFSVYLIYTIGKKWFNETVGLLSATYLASIQFTVMYSQIARPYISGLLFSLLMVHYWSNLIMNPDKNFTRNILLFIISSSLCTYNHYFSMLFAAIVGISGLFYIQRKFLIMYFISGLIIIILYIPHLRIFIYQLSVGGVEGWLGKPQNDFFKEFIYYIFNYSLIVIALTLGIILSGLLKVKKRDIDIKFIILSFAWFILPFLIGFIYSKYVNSVLQYSVLIFSFPFLLFILFGIIKNQHTKINLILVLAILLTNTFTLIFHRKHYDVFYKSVYKQVLTDYKNIKIRNGNTIYIIDSDKKISNYYISKLDIDSGFINYSDSFQSIIQLKDFLEKEADKKDNLYFGCLSSVSPIIIPLIQDYFPNIEKQNNYVGGTTYLFSKKGKETRTTISNLCFDSCNLKNWSSIDTTKIFSINDTIREDAYLIDNDVEWGPVFSVALKDIMKNENNFIDISVKVKTKEDLDDVILVGSLESHGKNISWSGTGFKEFILSQQDKSDWIIAHHSIKLSDIYLKYNDIILKVYIWNRGKKSFFFKDFTISLREGNPIVYGLNERL
jgi:hypothetical protein